MSAERGEPTPGDVESITSGEPGHTEGRVPKQDERVAIRLYDHPRRYVVRVAVTKQEPQIIELTIIADDRSPIDHRALREIPTRRLAHSAAQWLVRAGGQIAFPGDTTESDSQPENVDPRVWQAARRVEAALALGLPVRKTVASEMNVSPSTVDRLIAKAKAEGFLDAAALPKRPQPRQKDTNR